MKKRLLNFLALAGVTAFSWFAMEIYVFQYRTRIFYSLLALTSMYLVFKLVLEEVIAKRISDQKTQYVSRKAFSILYLGTFLVMFVRIWVEDPQALLVAYGLIGAGVAVALQDFFKNFVGGITLFVNGMYRVGDRVQLGETTGDVVDVGLMYTRLMEIKSWVPADQATGRIVTVPNGVVLGEEVMNYTADNTFIWDEIPLPVTYDSDWKKLKQIVVEIVEDETQDIASTADKEISEIGKKYYLSEFHTEPQVFTELTDNWIRFHVRYVTDVEKRRALHNRISQRILSRIEEADDIELASATHEIVGVPEMDLNLHQSE
jgi:small-conductance mechanosensitive channel